MLVQHGNSRVEVQSRDEWVSQKECEEVYVVSFADVQGRWMQLWLPLGVLRAAADMFYRLAGEQPRSVDQAVRVVVEHVAAAAPAAPPVDSQDAEKEAIKLRLMK
jgi:hypothetical protein